MYPMRYLKWTRPAGLHTYGDLCYKDEFVELQFTLSAAGLLFFDFEKYPYIRPLADKFVKALHLHLDGINKATGHHVKINKEALLAYGRNMELEMFPRNLDTI